MLLTDTVESPLRRGARTLRDNCPAKLLLPLLQLACLSNQRLHAPYIGTAVRNDWKRGWLRCCGRPRLPAVHSIAAAVQGRIENACGGLWQFVSDTSRAKLWFPNIEDIVTSLSVQDPHIKLMSELVQHSEFQYLGIEATHRCKGSNYEATASSEVSGTRQGAGFPLPRRGREMNSLVARLHDMLSMAV